ncbi:MAG: competence type IV pilus major pilin ComGC [Verrucomicrobiales bacterium]
MKLPQLPASQSAGPFKKGFTMLEMMIVVGIIGLIVALAIPAFLKSRTNSRIQICIETLSQIESAKQLWGVEHGKRDGDLPAESDLIGQTLYIKKMPLCPGGGTYSFQPIGTVATCNIPKHEL